MISRNEVCKAIKILRGEVHPDPTGLLRALALSLKVYQRRGEWSGTVDSACICLLQAKYDIDTQELKDHLYFKLNRTARYTDDWDCLEQALTEVHRLIAEGAV